MWSLLRDPASLAQSPRNGYYPGGESNSPVTFARPCHAGALHSTTMKSFKHSITVLVAVLNGCSRWSAAQSTTPTSSTTASSSVPSASVSSLPAWSWTSDSQRMYGMNLGNWLILECVHLLCFYSRCLTNEWAVQEVDVQRLVCTGLRQRIRRRSMV